MEQNTLGQIKRWKDDKQTWLSITWHTTCIFKRYWQHQTHCCQPPHSDLIPHVKLKPRASDQSNRYIELCIIKSQAGLHRWGRQTNESWSKEYDSFITPNRKHQLCLVLALFWFSWKNCLGTSYSGFVWVYKKQRYEKLGETSHSPVAACLHTDCKTSPRRTSRFPMCLCRVLLTIAASPCKCLWVLLQ